MRRPPVLAIRQRVDYLLATGQATTCGAVIHELLRGAPDDTEWQRLERHFRGLHFLTMTDEDWYRAARLDRELRRRGFTFPGSDVVIAQAAIGHGAILLHADADFDRIAQYEPLQVESHVEEARRS